MFSFHNSATQILEDRGQVLMTLCKGQGGTPADRPRRAWHDSWQVVAMAADADLILVKVVPFHVEEYRTYSSTGFRLVKWEETILHLIFSLHWYCRTNES